MPRSADMGDITRIKPTAQVQDTRLNVNRTSAANVVRALGDTRISYNTPKSGAYRLAEALGLGADALSSLAGFAGQKADKEYAEAFERGAAKQAAGASREEMKFGEMDGWDRSAAISHGAEIEDTLIRMAQEGKGAEERSKYLNEALKGVESQSVHFQKALNSRITPAIQKADTYERNLNLEKLRKEEVESLKAEARDFIASYNPTDDTSRKEYLSRRKLWRENAKAMKFTDSEIDAIELNNVKSQVDTFIHDRDFQGARETLESLRESYREGKGILSAIKDKDAVGKMLYDSSLAINRQERYWEDNELQNQKETLKSLDAEFTGKYAETEDVSALAMELDRLGKIKPNSAYDANKLDVERNVIKARMSELSLVKNARMEESEKIYRNIEFDITEGEKPSLDEYRKLAADGKISARFVKQVEQDRNSEVAPAIHEMGKAAFEVMSPYIKVGKDTGEVSEILHFTDGSTRSVKRSEVEGVIADSAEDCREWAENNPNATTGERRKAFREIYNDHLYKYGKKIGDTADKDKSAMLPEKDWTVESYNSNPQFKQYVETSIDKNQTFDKKITHIKKTFKDKSLQDKLIKDYSLKETANRRKTLEDRIRTGKYSSDDLLINYLEKYKIPVTDKYYRFHNGELELVEVPIDTTYYGKGKSAHRHLRSELKVLKRGVDAEEAYIIGESKGEKNKAILTKRYPEEGLFFVNRKGEVNQYDTDQIRSRQSSISKAKSRLISKEIYKRDDKGNFVRNSENEFWTELYKDKDK